jgi:hypothetical protein
MDESDPYRIVVRAVAGGVGQKSFVWEIFPRGEGDVPVKRTSRTFRSMADAYEHGQVELKRLTDSRIPASYRSAP